MSIARKYASTFSLLNVRTANRNRKRSRNRNRNLNLNLKPQPQNAGKDMVSRFGIESSRELRLLLLLVIQFSENFAWQPTPIQNLVV